MSIFTILKKVLINDIKKVRKEIMRVNKYQTGVYFEYNPGTAEDRVADKLLWFFKSVCVRSFLSIEGGKEYG